MSKRVKGYIDTDVLTEARARVHHIFDVFDTVMVAFSGGKDSLVCVHLVLDVMKERGIDAPLKVIFRDEELIPDSVVDFVNEYRQREDIDLRWYCVPLESNKYVLGASSRYVQWDPDRPHVRPMPPWGITNEALGIPRDFVADQYTMDSLVAKDEKGKVAIVTGVRADESLMRFRAMTAKISENYISNIDKRIATVKPIFDWRENDVFRYFYDEDIRYCPTYDHQLFAREPLRVSTPLHAERAKRLDNLRAYEPVFYDQVMTVFPEMAVQERYWSELDHDAVKARYGHSLDGVQAWIEDNIVDETQQAKALKELKSIRGRVKHSPEAFPPDYVLGQMMNGAYKRTIAAIDRNQQAARREKAKA